MTNPQVTTLTANSLLAVIVDKGRDSYSHLGVPTSGPLHLPRYLDACFLAGIPAGSAAVEIHNGSWEFTTDVSTAIGITGEGVTVDVDGNRLAAGTTLVIPAHAFVRVQAPLPTHPYGPTYVAINGMSPELTLGSASHDSFSKLGPDAIGEKTRIPMNTPDHDGSTRFIQPPRNMHSFIPMEPGPWNVLVGSFRTKVLTKSRSGIRLESVQDMLIEHRAATVASFPVMTGAIQLPASNAPIVLGPDAGTTGGYPVIGVLSPAALGLLSEVNPGEEVTFGFAERGNKRVKAATRHIVS